MTDKRGLLLLCVANSSRSQMAEGLAKQMAPDGVEVFSAGSAPATVNPNAVAVMREVGLDISTHHSKSVDEVPKDRIHTVITLCAEEVCPAYFESAQRLHWPLGDPAAATGSKEGVLDAFRHARDQIRALLEEHFQK